VDLHVGGVVGAVLVIVETRRHFPYVAEDRAADIADVGDELMHRCLSRRDAVDQHPACSV